MLRGFNSSMVIYLTMPTFIHCMLCMFMGGARTLSVSLVGKIEWLKSLSISEGILRIFNSSMVRYLMMPMVHVSYDMRNNINYGSMYFVLGGASPGKELPFGAG